MTWLTFVTTCKGRLSHLKQSLPTFASQPDSACVVVDYDCPEKSGAWVRENFPHVTVVHEEGRPRFELSRARNLGALAARSLWLCFVDADILLAPDFVERLRGILQPGFYYQAKPRTIETWGTSISRQADFERVFGYDEVLQGWGKDDDDYYARLGLAGITYATFPGELLRPLGHDDDARVKSYEVKDRWVSESINHIYCQAKIDWMLLRRAEPSLEMRKKLYTHVQSAVLQARKDGGPLEIKIPIMTEQTRACGPLEVRLSYALPSPRGTGIPVPNAGSLQRRMK